MEIFLQIEKLSEISTPVELFLATKSYEVLIPINSWTSPENRVRIDFLASIWKQTEEKDFESYMGALLCALCAAMITSVTSTLTQ